MGKLPEFEALEALEARGRLLKVTEKAMAASLQDIEKGMNAIAGSYLDVRRRLVWINALASVAAVCSALALGLVWAIVINGGM
jgi:hypothetical protein